MGITRWVISSVFSLWAKFSGNDDWRMGDSGGPLNYMAGKLVRWMTQKAPYESLFFRGQSHTEFYSNRTIIMNRNSDGVAIVRADDEIGAIYGQGFMQAIDRPWQLHTMSLVAQGKLSSMVKDPKVAQLDAHSRAMGYCQNEPGNDPVIEAFAAGVAEGLTWLKKSKFHPTETKFVGVEVDENWDAARVMCNVRLVLMSMSRGYWLEYSDAFMEALLNPEEVDVQKVLDKLALPSDDVNFGKLPDINLLNPQKTEWSTFRPSGFLNKDHVHKLGVNDTKPLDFYVPKHPDTAPGMLKAGPGFGGSQTITMGRNFKLKNNDGDHPMLLSDPHLKVTQPGFWHHIMMVTKKGTIVGGGAAGMPGIMIGHNDNMAWGPTLSYVDKEDLFSVSIVPCELDLLIDEALEYGVEDKDLFKGKQCYVYDKKHVPILFKEEEFTNKKGKQVKKVVVRHTHFGPIISDHFERFWVVADNLTKKRWPDEEERGNSHIALAHASVSRRSPFDSSYITKMFTMKSRDDFKKLLRVPGSAGMSVTVAYITKASKNRKDGEHGILISGGFPIRRNPEDNMIRNGEISADDWQGVLPFDKMPHKVGKPKSHLVTANQRLSQKNLGNSYNTHWRYDRLNFLLRNVETKDSPMTVDELQRLEMDQFSEQAHSFKQLVFNNLVDCEGSVKVPDPPTEAWCRSDPVIDPWAFNVEGMMTNSKREFDGAQSCKIRGDARQHVESGAVKSDALWVISLFLQWDCVIGYNSGIAAVYEYWLMSAAQVWVEGLGGNKQVINTFFGETLDPLIFAMPTRDTHWPGIFLREMKSDASAGVILARGLKRALLKIRQVYSLASVKSAVRDGTLRWGNVQQMVAVSSMHGTAVAVGFDTAPHFQAGGDGSTALPGFFRAKYLPYDREDKPTDRDNPSMGDDFLSSSTRVIAVPKDDWKESAWSLHPGTNGWLGDPFCKSYMDHLRAVAPMPFVKYDQFEDYVRNHAFGFVASEEDTAQAETESDEETGPTDAPEGSTVKASSLVPADEA